MEKRTELPRAILVVADNGPEVLTPRQRDIIEKTLRAHKVKGDAETKAKCDTVLDKLRASVRTGGT